MDNFDFKKYLAEGKLLKENEPTVFDDESMDELFNIISKYVEDPDDAQAELDSFDQGGFDAMSDMVIANLDRDPEYKAWYNKLHSIKENDPFYKSDSYLDDPKPQRLGPSSQFTFEPSDPKKDLMIHTIVDEYQEKIFDYLWNYELYKNEYLKEDINYDVFDEKPDTPPLDVQSMAAPLESALIDRGLDDLDDLNSIDDFLSFVKYLEKYASNEIPSEFFALKPIEQVRILSQAQMYI